ncbi:hypothetical protein [Ramlibacter sp. PS4R-6]|uniref:hypothetical protein n=1 Tax=Ramlibacter sp. PS4R-6 TaxID=3133438 RepID=UPI00309B18AB
MARRTHSSARLARQSTELALAAPQVVMHRMARMATAGASPSARDRAEFMQMGSEKVLAFYQSWARMWMSALSNYMAFTRSFASAAAAGTSVLSAGLAPVHSKAVANARRLRRR